MSRWLKRGCALCSLSVALLVGCSPLAPGQRACDAEQLPAHYLQLVEALSPRQQAWPAARWQAVDCHLASLTGTTQALELWRTYVAGRNAGQPLVGYKVALGSSRSQQLFALSSPVIGAFFAGELLPEGEPISVAAGRRLAFEADLLVEIGSDAIMQATTIEQVAAAVARVYPFIEVPDLMVPIAPASGPAFIATNAAARFGVYGEAIEARADAAFIAALGAMQIRIEDQHGAVSGSASGNQLMGRPYNALLYLVEALAAQGMRLHAGDRVSLGAFGPPTPVVPGDVRRVRYNGLVEGRELVVEAAFR